MKTIRVLIAADVRLYREGLAQVLSREPLLAVVGAVATYDEALAAGREVHPDIILLDMQMAQSPETVRDAGRIDPSIKVVAIGLAEADGSVVSCAEMGVAGYVPRRGSLEDLLAAVESVGRGEFLCSPQIAGTLQRRLSALVGERGVESEARLTAREREIVGFIDRGFSNKEIAHELGIELPTVKNHVHNLLKRLSVHRRSQAAAKIRRGARTESFGPPPVASQAKA